MTEEREIYRLIDRFFAGETTVEEEHRLAAMFRSDNLPEDLERYRPMFAWYDGLQGCQVKPARRVGLLRLVTVAAMVAVIATVAVGGYLKFRERACLEDVYAGSFVIRDGVKITDIDVVLSEMAEVEARIDQIEISSNDRDEKLLAHAEYIENKSFNTDDYE